MKIKLFIIYLLGSYIFPQDVIGEGLFEEELIDFLQSNYTTNSTLGYNPARDTLYLRIDRDNGEVKGIYTNYAVTLPSSGVDPSLHLYENGMNCEHIWPQSLGAGDEPQRSDMHILRPCKENVNSSRGNKPFNEINDSQTQTWYWQNSQTSTVPSSNIDEYSENSSAFFEPREDRKGDIARTMFYFFTIYPNVADNHFFQIQKDVLKTWHEQDPADTDEINRTWAIASYQNNKPNPFILDASLIERSYFYDGSIIGDINGDGGLNVLDVVSLINILVGEGECTYISDINADGACNVLDAVLLINMILS